MSKSMKVAAAVLALAAGTGAALAAGLHEANGTIERINPKGQRVTVGHQVYRYNPRMVGEALKRGEKVHISYRWSHGHRVADRIELKNS